MSQSVREPASQGASQPTRCLYLDLLSPICAVGESLHCDSPKDGFFIWLKEKFFIFVPLIQIFVQCHVFFCVRKKELRIE